MMQKIFSPARYTFEWTEDWYTWDDDKAHKLALRARNAEAKQLKQEGYRVVKRTLRNQLITQGGIGSGHPEISLVVNCYMVDAYQ